VGLVRREEAALHALETVALLRRKRHAGNHGEMGLVVQPQLGDKTEFRIGLGHAWNACDFLSGRFVEVGTFHGRRAIDFLFTVEGAKVAAGGHHNRVEKAG